METVCGTHHYLAPELVRCDRGEISSYDCSVDVWGIGLIAFIMLFGFNPFLCESPLSRCIVLASFSLQKSASRLCASSLQSHALSLQPSHSCA